MFCGKEFFRKWDDFGLEFLFQQKVFVGNGGKNLQFSLKRLSFYEFLALNMCMFPV